jgi:dipeptidyl aminopeptidase/acylaminoacyl peptidase
MAPLRRERDEQVVLRKGSASERVLAQGAIHGYWDLESLPSQRRFQVSPDARVLAYTSPADGYLHLLRRDGAEAHFGDIHGRDLRFSPDGGTLAFVRPTGRIERVDLRRLEARPWAELQNPEWIEFCADGLVVSHDAPSAGHALSLVPWDGPPRQLARTEWRTARFVAAKAGSRVVFFTYNREAWSIDEPGEEPRRIADKLPSQVTNAEMSPDGRAVAFASSSGLFVIQGDGEPELRSSDAFVHSVWFSRDGALAWASPNAAVWSKDGAQQKLGPGEGHIVAMRFLQASPGLVITRGREVVLWSPERGEEQVLISLEEPRRELLGADLFDGGVALWVGSQWLEMERFSKGKR